MVFAGDYIEIGKICPKTPSMSAYQEKFT